ncbi:hypothetical protein M432DRAFT_591266 [Thermoascus aurantiacus ATCC 26904]
MKKTRPARKLAVAAAALFGIARGKSQGGDFKGEKAKPSGRSAFCKANSFRLLLPESPRFGASIILEESKGERASQNRGCSKRSVSQKSQGSCAANRLPGKELGEASRSPICVLAHLHKPY